MADLAGGHLDLVFDGIATSMPMVRQGRVNLIAISGTRRNQSAPDLATFAEQGLQGYEAYSWNCLFAPANTPMEAMERLNAALNKAVAMPAVRERLIQQSGAEVLAPSTPAQADAFGRHERERWVPFIRSLKLDVG